MKKKLLTFQVRSFGRYEVISPIVNNSFATKVKLFLKLIEFMITWAIIYRLHLLWVIVALADGKK